MGKGMGRGREGKGRERREEMRREERRVATEHP